MGNLQGPWYRPTCQGQIKLIFPQIPSQETVRVPPCQCGKLSGSVGLADLSRDSFLGRWLGGFFGYGLL